MPPAAPPYSRPPPPLPRPGRMYSGATARTARRLPLAPLPCARWRAGLYAAATCTPQSAAAHWLLALRLLPATPRHAWQHNMPPPLARRWRWTPFCCTSMCACAPFLSFTFARISSSRSWHTLSTLPSPAYKSDIDFTPPFSHFVTCFTASAPNPHPLNRRWRWTPRRPSAAASACVID